MGTMNVSTSNASLIRQNSMPSPEKAKPNTAKVSQDDASHHLANKTKFEQKVPRLQAALQKELAHHWRYDRTVNQNQLTGTSYADQRRASLANIPGGSTIAAQYGVTFAAADTPSRNFLSTLKIHNEADSDYLRDSASMDYKDLCHQVYKRHTKNSQALPAVYVNSRHTAMQILQHFRGSEAISGTPEEHFAKHLKPLADGLYALEFKRASNLAQAEPFIHIYGARPSAYAVINALQDNPQKIEDDPKIDNQQHFNHLARLDDNSYSRLRDLPKDHSLSHLSHTAAALVEQMVDVFEERDVIAQHQHNPVLASGLQGLSKISDTLPSLSHDTTLFRNGYQVAMDELQVCLSATKPYNMEDFRMAAAPLVAPDKLPSNIPEPKVHLVSSGMGAISLGFELAEMLTGNQHLDQAETKTHGKSPDYFEVAKLRHQLFSETHGNPNGMYATLNGSLPTGDKTHAPWGVDAVIESVQQRLDSNHKTGNKQPLTLVLDATLEQKDDMEKLVSNFASDIGKGDLRIVVCKSYQKYANLCSAKVMAGGVSLISADSTDTKLANKHLDRVEKDLNLIANNDAQLMIHMLGCRDQEFTLLKKGMENAQFTANNFFHGEDGHTQLSKHSSNSPFLIFDQPKDPSFMDFLVAKGEVSKKVPTASHLSDIGLPSRDSFAFAHTSPCSFAQDGQTQVRLSFGQESKAELTELFYMPTLAMHANQHWDCDQALKLVQKLADEGISSIRIPPHIKPSLYQKLHIIGQLEQPKIDDQTRLQADPSALRAQQQKNDVAGLTMHKIVSVAAHLSELVQAFTKPQDWQTGADRPLLNTLTQGLIQSGLPRVSNYGKSAVLSLQAFLCKADMQTDSQTLQQIGLKRLADACINLPGLPGTGEHLLSVPENVFNDAKPIDKDHLLDAIFDPLDKQSQLDLIKKMADKGDYSKAQACLDRVEANSMKAPPTTGNLLPSSEGPQSLSLATQLAQIKQQLS